MKTALTAMAGLVLPWGGAFADDLTLQLKWGAQAQFAGYYVAQAKGFYDAEGVDVTILPGGPGIAPTQVLARGVADVAVEWMPAALAVREKGLPMVNIAQPFKLSGMMLTCLKESGIADPKADFPGRSMGVWFQGNEYPFLVWMNRLGLSTDGGQGSVGMIRQGTGIDLLLDKRAACISTMTYNEYGQLLDAGLTPGDLVTFRYADQGVATLEDGLYVLQSTLNDRDKVTALVRFVRASMNGWTYARDHPDEAAEIVLQNDPSGNRRIEVQTRMMTEVAKLMAGSDGRLDAADYQRTVDILMSGGKDRIISAVPEGAFTTIITDRAFD